LFSCQRFERSPPAPVGRLPTPRHPSRAGAARLGSRRSRDAEFEVEAASDRRSTGSFRSQSWTGPFARSVSSFASRSPPTERGHTRRRLFSRYPDFRRHFLTWTATLSPGSPLRRPIRWPWRRTEASDAEPTRVAGEGDDHRDMEAPPAGVLGEQAVTVATVVRTRTTSATSPPGSLAPSRKLNPEYA
jgi:hypothetical protein